MVRSKKRTLRLLGSLVFISICLVALLFVITYRADSTALRVYRSVGETQNTYSYFKSQSTTKAAKVIIYGGGLVDYKAYAYLANGLAEQGFDAYLLHSPLNLPVLNQGQALDLISSQELKHVFLIGHSLGGVVAAQDSQSAKKEIDGLVLLASYPGQQTDLASEDLAVLSITASEDRILNQEKYQSAKHRLPDSTSYLTISGGNHSGFGLYGQQRGDGQARLSSIGQQETLVQMIADFIDKYSN